MKTLKRRFRIAMTIVAFYSVRPNRVGEIALWFRHRRVGALERNLPWWTYGAIDLVSKRLPRDSRVVEYGGGGSTVWLAQRGATVIAIEHDRGWGEALRAKLGDSAEVRIIEPSCTGTITSATEPGKFFDEYVLAPSAEPDSSLDLVIVDGRARVECGIAARDKVRIGGMLLLDDSDRLRYRKLIEALDGWPRIDFRGAKAGGGPIFQTSVWIRSF